MRERKRKDKKKKEYDMIFLEKYFVNLPDDIILDIKIKYFDHFFNPIIKCESWFVKNPSLSIPFIATPYKYDY